MRRKAILMHRIFGNCEKRSGKFREYFPEHKDKKIVGSLGTLYAHKSLIRYASSKGILVLAVGDELMDVMNEPGFKPTEF